jgi:hypothetical protein
MDDLEGVVRQVIDGDSGFREISREALVGVTYGPALLSPTAVHLRQAYDAAVGGRLEESCDDADRAVKAALESGDERLAGWLGEIRRSCRCRECRPWPATSTLTDGARLRPPVVDAGNDTDLDIC